jgi:hypothetical protein
MLRVINQRFLFLDYIIIISLYNHFHYWESGKACSLLVLRLRYMIFIVWTCLINFLMWSCSALVDQTIFPN